MMRRKERKAKKQEEKMDGLVDIHANLLLEVNLAKPGTATFS
jgi:hypothetical protein